VTVEYAAGTTYHLSIAHAFKFFRNFARCRVPLEAFHDGKHLPNQITRRYRIFKRDVLCNFIQVR
jgi:hypothetical protein